MWNFWRYNVGTFLQQWAYDEKEQDYDCIWICVLWKMKYSLTIIQKIDFILYMKAEKHLLQCTVYSLQYLTTVILKLMEVVVLLLLLLQQIQVKFAWEFFAYLCSGFQKQWNPLPTDHLIATSNKNKICTKLSGMNCISGALVMLHQI